MGQSKITVRPDRVTGQLGDLYGIFFEDLNHAADGGYMQRWCRTEAFVFCAVDNPVLPSAYGMGEDREEIQQNAVVDTGFPSLQQT